jgi:hypothetical protein
MDIIDEQAWIHLKHWNTFNELSVYFYILVSCVFVACFAVYENRFTNSGTVGSNTHVYIYKKKSILWSVYDAAVGMLTAEYFSYYKLHFFTTNL